MSDDWQNLDPRVRRTRQLLQDSLARLMKKRRFDEITVQDVCEEATVNRATFYAHYPDKDALLACITASRFQGLLSKRGVEFDGTCGQALGNFFLGICEYLAAALGSDPKRQRAMDPQMESAIIAVVRERLLDGLRQHPPASAVSQEVLAATLSGALYGAAKEWVSTPHRGAPEGIVNGVTTLLAPLIRPL